MRTLDWLDANTGSLGQGFSVGVGQALAKKRLGDDNPVFVILGDGELQEGQVWEAAMFAAHHGLGNLIAIVDRNSLQSDALTEDIIGLEPLTRKWESFGWEAIEIDGHSFPDIHEGIEAANRSAGPSVLVANTVKGKGVPFMEGVPEWHGSVAMTLDQLESSLDDLGDVVFSRRILSELHEARL